MEEIFSMLKGLLKEKIEIKKDHNNLNISMVIKSNVKGVVAEPYEVLIMLKMFGGLKDEIPIEIEIDNENQIINLKFENKENFEQVSLMMDKIWDNAVEMLIQTTDGNFDVIRDIPDIDD